ncbi:MULTISPECIES: HNH endonuclease signature motif containing protein [unclassified Nocardioides]|uniref:HNH endonuclease signature motif containing protein n=1 Tax=unclassified Nocardioides TaxID=2615069 RepID=UPI0000570D47|nr:MULTISPECIES: HNH endonuclease signature motif containing protein [unclassified Nocardioides]ABL83680.1 HNH endonuclease [Nocardioides sp. JS614]
MAALPLEAPGPDTPAEVLAALETTHTALADAEIGQFRLAVEWAIAHPITSVADIATVEGTEGEVAIAGTGAPLVAEFCVADFAAAIGVSTDAGRAYLGDAVEVCYRLPLLWAQVMSARVPVWKARRIAGHTHGLSFEGAACVDRHLAPIAHRVSFAQIERTVEAARAMHDPAQAEQRRREAADGRFCDIDTTQVGLQGTMTVRGELDLADALDLDQALRHGAQQLADLGCTETLDVRRALAVGALARGDLTLGLDTHPATQAEADTDTQPESQAGPEAEPPPKRRRGLMLYAHLTDDAVRGLLATVENTRSQVLVGQVAGWCATATGPVTIRPVLDLHEHLQVPGYRPSPRLREQVLLTHPTCVFPHCTRPSRSCDLDHVIPWAEGGPTCSCNLVPACRFHHRLRTHGGWRLHRVGERLFVWTSPHGRIYTRHL